jgi:hypothetical protein
MTHPIIRITVTINIEKGVLDCLLYEKRIRAKEADVMVYSSRKNL